MRTQKGFTLVEILIVVVILGILAAIVIPQFTDASTQAKESSLCADLQTMRSQIELYKIQHNDQLPDCNDEASFVACMTSPTDIDGAVVAAGTPDSYGPYIQKIPVNQFNDQTSITISATDVNTPGDAGWFLNSTTGKWRADDTLSCSDGTAHIDL